ncbi:hypothetical protein [Pseudoclavibacter sp. VKM Ac-2867]|uniref:hypothetical protein n=1 Tax=Pseudoclavibacter sp. VKM Ac-2867 TaxID=2783829 RepID=UPI00188A152A|nr:hypothetical protein [Pseudoclavibacter sp. VKM Ac-2867]MBF4459463.1 hypothetical protein [Pseudoclavibacter sp. VKM Ac-2867]
MSNVRALSVPSHTIQVFADDASIHARVDATPTEAHFGEEGIAEIRVADSPVLVIDLSNVTDLRDALDRLLTEIADAKDAPLTPAAALRPVPTSTRHLTPTL